MTPEGCIPSINEGEYYPSHEERLKFYNEVFDECAKHGVEPLVTLSHYETPDALSIKYGGWKDRKCIDFFERYAKTVIDRSVSKVKYYLTFNEINIMSMMPYMVGDLFDFADQAKAQAAHNQSSVNAKVVRYTHENHTDILIDQVLAYGPTYSYTYDPADHIMALEKEHTTLWYSDVQAGGFDPEYKLKEYERKEIVLDDTPDDYILIEQYSDDFLSFSCYGSNTVTKHTEGSPPKFRQLRHRCSKPIRQDKCMGLGNGPGMLKTGM